MTSDDCKTIVRDELRVCNAQIKAHYEVSPIPLQLRWDLTGCTAGIAVHGHEIRINVPLLMMQPEAQVRWLAAHEIAHCAVALMYIRDVRQWTERNPSLVEHRGDLFPARPEPHGYEWQRVMHYLNYAPVRCHSFDTSSFRRVREPLHLYCLTCGPIKVGPIVYRRQVSGTHQYVCKRCQRVLVHKLRSDNVPSLRT